MGKMKSFTVGIGVVLIVAVVAGCEMDRGDSIEYDLSSDEILEKTREMYAGMDTYRSEGVITSDIDTGGTKMKMETSFSILLKKPDMYRITWTQKGMPMPGMSQSGAVWSDGTQPYLYMGIMQSYSKIEGDDMALASATGISGGVAHTIPSFFITSSIGTADPFSGLNNPRIEKIENVGDEECYVIAGDSAISKDVKFWISKKDFMIRKFYRSLEMPEKPIEMPEMTDEMIEESLKALGQDATEESKESMRKMMKGAGTMLETMQLKGYTEELHKDITSPDLQASDFVFEVPAGTTLKDSMFGGLLSGEEK